jgi:hypothetical protein
MAPMYLIITALIVAGWLALLIDSRRVLKRTCAELRLEFQRQIDSLSAKVEALEGTADAKTVFASEVMPVVDSAPKGATPAQATAAQVSEEIAPETLATIAETITALLGKKVRIRSVRMLQTRSAVVNTWAQQGRVVVHASHNFAQRGREQ